MTVLDKGTLDGFLPNPGHAAWKGRRLHSDIGFAALF